MEDITLYTKISNYKDILDIFELIKHKLEDLKIILSNIEEIKEKESTMIEEWRSSIKSISGRIEEIDSKLMSPK